RTFGTCAGGPAEEDTGRRPLPGAIRPPSHSPWVGASFGAPAILPALILGVVAGLRAMLAPAAASWLAHPGLLQLDGTFVAFLANAWTRWILTGLALVELVTDQLPSTPSRTVPIQFGTRIVTGGLSGAAIGAANGAVVGGLLAGAAGAIIGTLGGRAL